MNIYNTNYQFLYCFDENYNKQAFTSMISLLENLESPVEINIIHPDENLMKEVPLRILNHPKLIKLNIHNFINAGYDFPNIDDSHVSEATYYRLFIEDYIEKEVSFIVALLLLFVVTRRREEGVPPSRFKEGELPEIVIGLPGPPPARRTPLL